MAPFNIQVHERVVYLDGTDNSPVGKDGGIPSFHDYGRGMTWDTTGISTTSCCSGCCGYA